jgi:aspartate racemase
MKKVGIIGGIGPVSTLDYYSGVIHGVRARVKDDNYPEIIVNSINMTKMLSFVANKDWDALVNLLLSAIRSLADAGAEFAAIASNTPHIVFDEVHRQSALPLISIIETTCEYARAKGCKKAVVLGTRFTMGSGIYSEAFKKYGMNAIIPSEEMQAVIHGLIFPKLEDGIVVPEDKRKMLEIANGLITECNADAVVLGCTELPLMIKDGDLGTMLLNTTQIHIEAIVRSICISRAEL